MAATPLDNHEYLLYPIILYGDSLEKKITVYHTITSITVQTMMEDYATGLEEQRNNTPVAWLRDIKYRILLCRSLKHDLYDYLIDCHSSLTYNHGKLNQESENETGTYSENFSRR